MVDTDVSFEQEKRFAAIEKRLDALDGGSGSLGGGAEVVEIDLEEEE